MGILVDRKDFLEIRDDSNQSTVVDIDGLGSNSVQTIEINQRKVTSLCVNFVGEGAITQISFCADVSAQDEKNSQAPIETFSR